MQVPFILKRLNFTKAEIAERNNNEDLKKMPVFEKQHYIINPLVLFCKNFPLIKHTTFNMYLNRLECSFITEYKN